MGGEGGQNSIGVFPCCTIYDLKSQTVDSPKWLIEVLKLKLRYQYIQDWIAQCNVSSSSKNYVLIKSTFERSAYIRLLPDNLTKIMFAFRSRNHRFPVEVGRWIGLPLAERKCELCHKGLGDEFHYLLTCEYFTRERKMHIKTYFYKNPNILKYNELMNTTDIPTLKKLCIFISKLSKSVRFSAYH